MRCDAYRYAESRSLVAVLDEEYVGGRAGGGVVVMWMLMVDG